MTFKPYREAYVWVWLPEEVEPVIAGRIEFVADQLIFNYGKSYLQRENKISLFSPELPLKEGRIEPLSGLKMAGCLRDGAPDAWGRRVIINRKLGTSKKATDVQQFDELTYLLESGSDRVGALDFQLSATHYEPRTSESTSLKELIHAADYVERGTPLTPELADALQHGTAIGGARPKALITDHEKKYVAKFSSSTDLYSVVKAEYLAMRLAKYVGIDVADVHLRQSMGKDILLVERFDRIATAAGWKRKALVSALTQFQLDEMLARYASYQTLAEKIPFTYRNVSDSLREVFKRMTFNVLVGNTDDHARNHAAFWDGQWLELTPAYDICPQPRTGSEASQAMFLYGKTRSSQLLHCLTAASNFRITEEQAIFIIEEQVEAIVNHWDEVSEEARLTAVDENFLRNRPFLNPFIFGQFPTSQRLQQMVRSFRG